MKNEKFVVVHTTGYNETSIICDPMSSADARRLAFQKGKEEAEFYAGRFTNARSCY